jgi:pentatricopeptide repeat protein
MLSLYNATLSDPTRVKALDKECFSCVLSALGREGRLNDMLKVYEDAQRVKEKLFICLCCFLFVFYFYKLLICDFLACSFGSCFS